MIEIKNKEELNEVLKNNKNVIMYFSAVWCPPCKALMPSMQGISGAYSDKLSVAHIDVDSNGDLAAEYEIRSIPVLLFIKEGQVTEKHLGGLSSSALAAKVKTFLGI